MKTFFAKNYVLLLLVSFFIVSCSEDNDTPTEINFSAEDTTRAAQADNAAEGALTVLENGYAETEEGRSSNNSFFPPECTTITISPDGNGGGNIVLDFGDGCQLNNGAFVTGSILLEYGPIESATRTINYTYTNFTYNNNGVTGGGEIFRELSNENGNPQSTINAAITVSFPNTTVTATRTGLRIAEWVAGVGSGTWTDNVYNITGNWNTELTNGFTRSGVVSETLVRELSCQYLVSGVLDLQQNNFTAQLDFGDGDCDNQATFIFNGEEFPIILGD